MDMKVFYKKFIDTYKATYEVEKKLLTKKQSEQINSLKISVSMGQDLDEKKLLAIVKKYVSVKNQEKRVRTYTYLDRKDSIDHLVYSLKKVI